MLAVYGIRIQCGAVLLDGELAGESAETDRSPLKAEVMLEIMDVSED